MVAKLLFTASTAPFIRRPAVVRSITSDISASSASVRGAPHQRPHPFSMQYTAQIARFKYIENDYGQVLTAAQRGRRMIHDGQVVGEQVHVVESRQVGGVRVQPRVLVVYAVYPVFGHQQCVGVYLERPERRPRVGSEERVTCPGSEDDDAALLQVPYRAPADVGFGDLLDLDS